MANILSRDAILAAEDRRFVEVEVPEWGGSVRVASLTAAQLLEYLSLARKEGSEHVGWLLAACIVDGDGKPLFTPGDVPALQAKSPSAVLRLFGEASKMNVLTKEAAEIQRGN